MKYIPRKMIKKSRFRDLYASLDKQEKTKTEEGISRLIAENKDFADRRNYGHLCNLFSSLSLVWMLEDEGKNEKEAEEIVFGSMYRFLSGKRKSMQRLARHRFFVPMLKKLMPVKFAHELGFGWEVDFPDAPKNCFCMTTHRCIYKDLFSKYGLADLTQRFCRVDDFLYGDLPNTEFRYTERIGEGGEVCDYVFERKKS